MIHITIEKLVEPNEKQWFEIIFTCGNRSMVMDSRITWNEQDARQKAARLMHFAPEIFHFDPTAPILTR